MNWIMTNDRDKKETHFLDLDQLDGVMRRPDRSIVCWMRSGRQVDLNGSEEFLEKAWDLIVTHVRSHSAAGVAREIESELLKNKPEKPCSTTGEPV